MIEYAFFFCQNSPSKRKVAGLLAGEILIVAKTPIIGDQTFHVAFFVNHAKPKTAHADQIGGQRAT
jgi:xanthosine utilization system XapX-like protein